MSSDIYGEIVDVTSVPLEELLAVIDQPALCAAYDVAVKQLVLGKPSALFGN